MQKILYHGSERIVQRPTYGKGNPKNDYGLGFYCTENPDLAREWACSDAGDGFVNQYTIDLEDLGILYLNRPEFGILHWLAVLLENRTFDLRTPVSIQARQFLLENYLPDYQSYDIIIGYRADDSYFSFSRAFLENGITLSQLERAMHLGKLGEQVVLRSLKAFDHLHFEEAVPVDSSIYYPRRIARDREARESYFRMLGEPQEEDASYVIELIRQSHERV